MRKQCVPLFSLPTYEPGNETKSVSANLKEVRSGRRWSNTHIQSLHSLHILKLHLIYSTAPSKHPSLYNGPLPITSQTIEPSRMGGWVCNCSPTAHHLHKVNLIVWWLETTRESVLFVMSLSSHMYQWSLWWQMGYPTFSRFRNTRQSWLLYARFSPPPGLLCKFAKTTHIIALFTLQLFTSLLEVQVPMGAIWYHLVSPNENVAGSELVI